MEYIKASRSGGVFPESSITHHEEEIALWKDWLADSENSKDGNAKKQSGFWVEVLKYIESKTKQYSRRTYDMKSGAGDEDYVQRPMIHYEIETVTPFKHRHYWDILKDRLKWQERALSTGSGGSKRHKSSGSSSFNTESGEQSINLNTIFCDTDEDEVQEIRPEGRDKARAAARKKKGSKSTGSSNVNEDALAKLMVTEMTAQEKEERLAFFDIKMRKVECRERELEQQDVRFYLQPYDHLTGDQRKGTDEIRAKIKA
nr:hypothetical protein [Tanacetum cinerariifolium]